MNILRKTVLLACLGMTSVAPTVRAGGEVFPMDNAAYNAECGSCHVPYPAQLLPKESWRALMRDLARHFGTDASLDAETARQIQSYLEANASRARAPAAKAPLRITQTDWFGREHDDVPPALWKHSAVKGPANCSACHTAAERGDYSERTLRLPR
jgi:hypothetical protein